MASASARASWKRRFFCLCGSEVFYYYTAEMSNPFQPLGAVPLQQPRPRDPAADQCPPVPTSYHERNR